MFESAAKETDGINNKIAASEHTINCLQDFKISGSSLYLSWHVQYLLTEADPHHFFICNRDLISTVKLIKITCRFFSDIKTNRLISINIES